MDHHFSGSRPCRYPGQVHTGLHQDLVPIPPCACSPTNRILCAYLPVLVRPAPGSYVHAFLCLFTDHQDLVAPPSRSCVPTTLILCAHLQDPVAPPSRSCAPTSRILLPHHQDLVRPPPASCCPTIKILCAHHVDLVCPPPGSCCRATTPLPPRLCGPPAVRHPAPGWGLGRPAHGGR